MRLPGYSVPELNVNVAASGENEEERGQGSPTGRRDRPLPSARVVHTLPSAQPLNTRVSLSGDQLSGPTAEY